MSLITIISIIIHDDIYSVRVTKVIFSDVTHPLSLSSEVPLGWMPFVLAWTIAKILSCLLPPSPPRGKKLRHFSNTADLIKLCRLYL